ncbi:MAG: sodium:proton antiporter [Clostridiaceae bacterium]|nr:sodium:proton antiporter [Clostridiaceae bacterium]
MITSLALVFLLGLSLAEIFRKIKLPRIIGLLLTGIILGPYVLDWLDPSLLSISSELRQIALIIILLKAGLSLDLTDLKAVGRPAVMMAFVPASFEIFAYVLIAPALLGVNRLEGAILGAVLAAVSPAVVVPKMLQLMEDGYGTNKKIPQLILAGASADDIFVIVLFSTFIGIAQGNSASILDLLNIPISIGSGILLGVIAGFCLYFFFETAYAKENYVRNSMKVVIILGVAFLLMAIEDWAKSRLAISGLLAIISMAAVLKAKSIPFVSGRLSEKFGKLWLAAEVILFVMVGTAVDINYTMKAGLPAILMIFLALIFRSFGVALCLIGTDLTWKERLFSVIAYLPKATVQAAIGAVPLGLGLPCGQIVLSVAVLAILITAPLGALGMNISYKKLLHKSAD